MEKKPVIIEIDNVRIRRWDDNNLFIEREETKEIYNPQTKKREEKTSYQFKGYYSTIPGALHTIHTKGLLVDERAVINLNSLLKQIESSNGKVIEAINNLEGLK